MIMKNDVVFHAVADGMRRRIIEALKTGPLSVAELAKPLPVSRPAVSQHLKVLRDAGIVTVEHKGTRNLNALAPEGFQSIRDWIDALEPSKFDRPKAEPVAANTEVSPSTAPASAKPEPVQPKVSEIVEPAPAPQTATPLPRSDDEILRFIDTRLSAEEAFNLFVYDLALWWPVATHSLSATDGALPSDVHITARPGGQIVETLPDGSTSPWGTFTKLTIPENVEIDWHVGELRIDATQLKITFEALNQGSRVVLRHSGWARFGANAPAKRAQYEEGWDHVLLERFAASAAASISNFSGSL